MRMLKYVEEPQHRNYLGGYIYSSNETSSFVFVSPTGVLKQREMVMKSQ